MKLIRVSNPSYQLNAVDCLMNDLFNQSLKSDFYGKNEISFQPATNILERESAIHVELLIPGFEKEQIKIQVEKGILSIKGEVEENKEIADNYKQVEFKKQNFEKKFKLTENVDAEKISALFKNGILTLNIPKKSEAVLQVRQIEVN